MRSLSPQVHKPVPSRLPRWPDSKIFDFAHIEHRHRALLQTLMLDRPLIAETQGIPTNGSQRFPDGVNPKGSVPEVLVTRVGRVQGGVRFIASTGRTLIGTHQTHQSHDVHHPVTFRLERAVQRLHADVSLMLKHVRGFRFPLQQGADFGKVGFFFLSIHSRCSNLALSTEVER